MPIHKSKMYLFIKKLSVILLRITPSLLKEYDLDCAPSCPELPDSKIINPS